MRSLRRAAARARGPFFASPTRAGRSRAILSPGSIRPTPVLAADRDRLAMAREARHKQAEAYFAEQADNWDRIRTLHVSEERVEAALLAMLGDKPFYNLLDLGAGTGRMLELLAPQAGRAVGVDQSAAMLALARSRARSGRPRNVTLRQGDIYAPPVERNGYDLVVIHQVLHFLDDPARALKQAALALSPGGRLAGGRFRCAWSRLFAYGFRSPQAGLRALRDRGLFCRGRARSCALRARRPGGR